MVWNSSSSRDRLAPSSVVGAYQATSPSWHVVTSTSVKLRTAGNQYSVVNSRLFGTFLVTSVSRLRVRLTTLWPAWRLWRLTAPNTKYARPARMPSPMLITRSSVPSESCADQSKETSGQPITAHLEPVPAAEHAEVDEEDVEDCHKNSPKNNNNSRSF